MGKKLIRNYDNEGNLISKECSCCHEVKPTSEFNKDKNKNDGLQVKCRQCKKQYYKNNKEYYQEYSKQYREDNKEYFKQYKKQYREDNKEHIKHYSKQYREDNKEYIKQCRENNKEYYQEYYKDNKEYVKEYKKQYYKNNKEYYQEYNKQYTKQKTQEALQQIKAEVEKYPEKYNYTEDKEIYGIIYLVHNIESDKYYVGQTTRSFDLRYDKGWFYKHGHKEAVKHDLQLYGENSFEYIKIFKVAYSQYELDKLEAYYIDYFNSYENGYNETRGNVFTNRGKEK